MLGGFGVPHSADSASLSRQRLASLLDAQGVPREVVQDVVLIVSELVGNAVRHARGLPSGGLHVDWEIGPGVVQVAVTDGGGVTVPEARDPGPNAAGGRGLAIVDALTSEWGVRLNGGATTVWASVRSGELQRANERQSPGEPEQLSSTG